MYNGSKRSKINTEENKFCVSWDPGSHLLDPVCAGEERRGRGEVGFDSHTFSHKVSSPHLAICMRSTQAFSTPQLGLWSEAVCGAQALVLTYLSPDKQRWHLQSCLYLRVS